AASPAAARGRRSVAVGAGLALAAAACALLLIRRAPTPAYEIGSGVPGIVGTWIVSREAETVPVRVWEGAALLLAERAEARVEELDHRGGRVRLERGRITAAIHHRRDARWLMTIGPYEIKVTGTRFDTGWNPELRAFDLAMHEGSVEVSGPGLP